MTSPVFFIAFRFVAQLEECCASNAKVRVRFLANPEVYRPAFYVNSVSTMPLGLEIHFLYLIYTLILILSLSFVFFVGYNFFLVLIYLELSALAVSSLLVLTANYFDSFFVEFFAVLFMAIVGAESAIAISILILATNQGLELNSYALSSLKG